MGASLLTVTTAMQCQHGVPVTHPPSQVRVRVNQGFALTVSDVGVVAGCPFTLPGGKVSPCVTVQCLVGSARIKLSGQPAVLQITASLCKSPESAPQGAVIVTGPQPRVTGI